MFYKDGDDPGLLSEFKLATSIILLIFGLYMYKMSWHYSIGQYFWNRGGKEFYKVAKHFSTNVYLEVSQKKKQKFERKIIKDRENK